MIIPILRQLVLSFCLLFICAGIGLAQAPTVSWLRQYTNDHGLVSVNNVATDATGNVYLCGYFSYMMNFGNSALISSSGGKDMFLVKVNSSGTVEWVVTGGGPNTEEGNDVVVDDEGNIYITGIYGLNSVFSGVPLAYHWNQDIFLAKYNPAGHLLWVKEAGGNGPDVSRALSVKNGYCYIAGEYMGNFFIGTDTLTSGGKFIARYDTDGNFQWSRRAPGTGTNTVYDVAIDPNGDCLITGYFGTTAQFGTTSLTGGGMFVAKYDTAGTLLWAQKGGTVNTTFAYGIGTDGQGNSYVAGRYTGNQTFGSWVLPYASSSDLFIAKYDSQGNLLWIRHGGSNDFDHVRKISVDQHGNSFIIGNFTGTATFGGVTASGSNNPDIFLVSYDAAGNERWVVSAIGSNADNGISVVSDEEGNCHVAGQFRYNLTMGGTTLTNNENQAFFLAKFSAITGLPEDGASATPDLYPNPFTTSFTIQLSGPERIKAVLTDVLGREVYRQDIAPQAGNVTATITPPANLPSGVYVLQLQQGDTTKQVRVVRQ